MDVDFFCLGSCCTGRDAIGMLTWQLEVMESAATLLTCDISDPPQWDACVALSGGDWGGVVIPETSWYTWFWQWRIIRATKHANEYVTYLSTASLEEDGVFVRIFYRIMMKHVMWWRCHTNLAHSNSDTCTYVQKNTE